MFHKNFLNSHNFIEVENVDYIFKKHNVYIGVNLNKNRCVIMRRCQKIVDKVLSGNFKEPVYSVIYKGKNPFTDETESQKLFDKLKINFVSMDTKSKIQLERLDSYHFDDEIEDLKIYLNR